MFVGFVDESKSKDYILAVTLVLPQDLRDVRQQLQQLRRNGQRRLHFSKEKDGRRKEILTHLRSMNLQTHFYVSKIKNQASARDECLTALVEDIVSLRVHRLVIERDHSYEVSDRRLIREILLRLALINHLEYLHDEPSHEPCLWIPDAMAWVHFKGGEWPRLAGLN
jgi:hypothetical protein